jgi:hypothetical protein
MRDAGGFIVALAIGLLAGDSALACSCRLPTADELLQRSAAIFTGTALQTRTVGGREGVTAFRVVTGYKGAKRGQLIRVHHRIGHSASCGVRFDPGKRHTLALQRDDDGRTLSISACSLAAMRSDAGEELVRRLGR